MQIYSHVRSEIRDPAVSGTTGRLLYDSLLRFLCLKAEILSGGTETSRSGLANAREEEGVFSENAEVVAEVRTPPPPG